MIADAIKIIEYIDEKDSEIYSLLALEQSFNFQFIPRQEFMVYSVSKKTPVFEKFYL